MWGLFFARSPATLVLTVMASEISHRQLCVTCYSVVMTYTGGKGAAGTAQTIINEQPPHRIYIEPFLGSGAVLRLKRPAAVNIGIDVDAGCIASWGVAAWPDFTISCKDSLTYLRSEALPADTLIYADPPYPLSCRARPRR